MKKIKFMLILPLATSLLGCAQLGAKPAMQPSGMQAEEVKNIEPKLMFELMLGEMLAERGDPMSAYNLLFPIAQATQDVRLAERSFQLAMSAGFAKGIEQSAALWRTLDPMQASAWRVGYLMALRHGEVEEAISAWQSYRKVSDLSLEDDLKNASAQAVQATQPEIGMAFFQRLGQLYPQDWSAGFALAYAANHYNQPLLALEALEDVATRLAAPLEVYFALANLYIEQDLTARGLAFLAEFMAQNPTQWMMQERFARLEVKAALYLSAKQRYQRIIDANPRAFTSLLSLALLELELGELAQAQTYFLTLSSVEGYRDVSHYYLGVISQSNQDLEQAKRYLQKVSHPSYYLDANILIAQIKVTTNGLDAGITHLQTLQPSNNEELVKVLRAQAIFYGQFSRWDQALAHYQLALDLAPDDLPIMYGLVMVLYEMEDFEAYEVRAKALVARFPDEPDALNALGYFYVERNINLDEAQDLLDRALAIDPDRYHILDSRGWLAYQRGNYVEAEAYLQRAWSIRKDDEVLIHLIKTKWAQNQVQAAKALWQDYAPLFPDNLLLQNLINELTGN
ncbi:tetratricopeptide repeat protein [Thiomicrospira microaerophila]|uniref:tetratricopeptide repeat protein n=1 Tax=Thiomicrospira microaerophila TaxID=406020 RepID=UPI00069692B0|nr:tetratricopeptide repeat protein [Thiomicrospira microaerophila]